MPDILEWIDLANMHVHSPTPVVLVMGGPFDLSEKIAPQSFRDAFFRVEKRPTLRKIEFRMAEEANITHPDDPYTNWQSFEIDIAQLFQLVLLFCESEGSIAELAAFSIIDEIASRMLVVTDEVNFAASSYIKTGVFNDLIEKYGRTIIYVMNYDGLNITHKEPRANIDLDEFAARMTGAIPAALERNKDPRSFDGFRDGHLIKLITGLIQHFGALKLDEISFILSILGIPKDDLRIRQFLRSAEFLNWLSHDERGEFTFYVAVKPRDAIEYRLIAGSPKLEKPAWRAQVREYWREHEPDRFAAIRKAAAKM